jgi:hypothetical protein
MSRFIAASFLVYALAFLLAQPTFAQTTQSSGTVSCHAIDATHKFAGASEGATYTVSDPNNTDQKITITNLSKQKCSLSCPTTVGGTVPGMCTEEGGKSVCKANATCANAPLQQVTLSQIQNAINGTAPTPPTVSPDQGMTSQQISQTVQQSEQANTTNSTGITTQQLLNSMQGTSLLQQALLSPTPIAQNPLLIQSTPAQQQLLNITGLSGGTVDGIPSQSVQPSTVFGATAPPDNSFSPNGPQQYSSNTFQSNGSLGTVVTQNPDGTFTVLRGSGTSAPDWLQQVNNLAGNMSNGGCPTSGCIIVNTGDRATLYFGGASNPGTYVIQSNGALATGIWSTVFGVNAQDITAQLQQGIQVTTPQGTTLLQADPELATAAGQSLATDYNNAPLMDRLTAYFNANSNGLSVSYTAPTPTDQPTPPTPPEVQPPPAIAIGIVQATPQDLQEAAKLGITLPTISLSETPSSPEPLPAVPVIPVQTETLPPLTPDQGTPPKSTSQPAPDTSQPAPSAPGAAPAPAAGSSASGKVAPAGAPGGGDQGAAPPASAGGATGGNQNNAGGSAGQGGNATGFLSLLSGLLRGLNFSPPAAPAPASPPIVYSANAPIVVLPASSDGLLGVCKPVVVNGQVQQCGATSNIPKPQITTDLPLTLNQTPGNGTSQQPSKGSGTGGIQTIIPGQTQQGQSSNGTTNTGSGATSPQKNTASQGSGGQGGNNTPPNPQGTAKGPTGTTNPSGSQQGGTGVPATTPGNGGTQSQPPQASTQPKGTGTQPNSQSVNGAGSGSGQASQGSGAGNGAPTSLFQSLINALKNLFTVGSAQANEAPQDQSALDRLKRDVQIASQGLDNFISSRTAGKSTKASNQAVKAGIGAAQRLAGAISGSLGDDVQKYVKDAQDLGSAFGKCVPENQPPEQDLSIGQKVCLGLGGVAGMAEKVEQSGRALLPQVADYVKRLKVQPPAVFKELGSATPPVTVVHNPNPGTEGPPPVPRNPLTNVPAAIPTQNGRVAAELPGPDQMGPITHDGMPPQQAAPYIGKTFYTSEATTFNDIQCASGTCPTNQLGIAHRTWPLGSKVEVCNTNNNQCAVATVIDRGPAEWLTNRTIDANPALTNAIGLNGKNPATYKLLSVPSVNQTAEPSGVASVPCNYKGCPPPTPSPAVAAARVPGVTSVPNCSGATGVCATDPTSGTSFSCEGDQTSCLDSLKKQIALSRLCANDPSTCNANVNSFKETPNGSAQPAPEPRKIIPIQSNYGTMGRLAKNPNVPTISGVPSQQLINGIKGTGVPVVDRSSASLSNYPHGKTQGVAVTLHGDGASGPNPGLVQTEVDANNAGRPAAQAVLLRDGTLVVVAPLDAVSFHAATTNNLGFGIEIEGLRNDGDDPTPAQLASMQKITSYFMDQLGWMAGTHGQIEPGHKDSEEAGPSTISYVYQGIAPGPIPTYTLTDSDGNPVMGPDGKPLTTTQAPGSDGTTPFLVDADGKPLLDKNGNPIPVNPVDLAQDSKNPNQYNAPDDRPEQPKPANPWLGHTAGDPYNTPGSLQPAQIAQAQQQPPRYTQPPYQTAPQPVAQPLPLPLPTGTSTPSSGSAAVTIVANPARVASSSTSRIVWSSVGTVSCQVGPQSGTLIGTSTNGSALSAPLSTSTIFAASCTTTTNTNVIATTSVTVQ